MGIKIGNLNLGSAFVGNKAIKKIYIGNDLKWSDEQQEENDEIEVGNILQFDNASARYRVLKDLGDGVYDVLYVETNGTSSSGYSTYEDSSVDALCKNYDAGHIQNALIDMTFYQDMYQECLSTDVGAIHLVNDTNETQTNLIEYVSKTTDYGNQLTRKVRSLSLTDIVDYLGNEITTNNLSLMIKNTTSTVKMGTMSLIQNSDSVIQHNISGYWTKSTEQTYFYKVMRVNTQHSTFTNVYNLSKVNIRGNITHGTITGNLRVSCGEGPSTFTITIVPDEGYGTPRTIGGQNISGYNGSPSYTENTGVVSLSSTLVISDEIIITAECVPLVTANITIVGGTTSSLNIGGGSSSTINTSVTFKQGTNKTFTFYTASRYGFPNSSTVNTNCSSYVSVNTGTDYMLQNDVLKLDLYIYNATELNVSVYVECSNLTNLKGTTWTFNDVTGNTLPDTYWCGANAANAHTLSNNATFTDGTHTYIRFLKTTESYTGSGSGSSSSKNTYTRTNYSVYASDTSASTWIYQSTTESGVSPSKNPNITSITFGSDVDIYDAKLDYTLRKCATQQ